MSNTPRISIIMPIFNGAKFLPDALSSILMQTETRFELLIADGGSTDKSLEILENANDPRIRIVSRADDGVPDALNKGFSAAKADIICWINSDDVYLRDDILADALKFLNDRYDFCVTPSCIMNIEGTITRTLFPWLPARSNQYVGGLNIFTGSLFFKRDLYETMGPIRKEFSIAFENQIIKHLISNGRGKVLNVAPGAAFRIYPGTLSYENRGKIRQQASEIFKNAHHPKNKWTALIARGMQHIKQGNLLQVILTSIFDVKKGKKATHKINTL